MGQENARVENNGKNYGVWKMQDWKMTDKLLANSGQNYGVWKCSERYQKAEASCMRTTVNCTDK